MTETETHAMSQAAGHDRRFFEPAYEAMDRQPLAELQWERLRAQLTLAYDHAPLIRSVWREAGVTPADIGSLDDYRDRAPFIDKDAIRRYRDEHGDPHGGLLCLPAEQLTTVMSTSGTTGDATLFSKSWDTSLPEARDLARHLWASGARPGDHVIYMCLSIRGPLFQAAHMIGAIPIMLDHSPDELRRFAELSLRLRPTVLYLLSGPLVAGCMEMADEIDFADVFSSYAGVMFGGEPLGARARATLDEWGVRTLTHTSNCDIGFASECLEQSGCHVWEDLSFVEVLEPGGTADMGNEPGELVGTDLTSRASPLIRYRSGDIVRRTLEQCACGRTHARIEPLGRKQDAAVIRGRTILPVEIWPAIESVEESRAGLFQIVRSASQTDVLRVRVGHVERLERSREEISAELSARIESEIGVPAIIELIANADLLKLGPPHKIPRSVAAEDER